MLSNGFSDLLKDEKVEEVSHLLKLMAHPMRLKLLCHLIEGEKSVLEIAELCDAPQVATSQALAKLKADHLVECRKEGQFVYYRIADERIGQMMTAMRKIFCGSKN